MPDLEMLRAVVFEYGPGWAINRALYSAKLKTLSLIPALERLFEKKTPYPERFDLFNIDIRELKEFIRGLDDTDREELLNVADKACRGVVRAFSWLDLDCGDPVDWQLNPLTGKRCGENVRWYRIPDFDRERGDIKIIWEASRFSHFITLARAFLLTDDPKYYKAFSRQLDEWLKKNPYGYGANYKCGQECSLRMVNALLAFAVFSKAGVAGETDRANIAELTDRCYRKILSNFFYAYRCIKNNHTVSELMGIIVGAWCCEDQRRLKKAFRLLDKVIAGQFTDDGGYRQFSFNYQRLVLQDLEVVLSVEKAAGLALSDLSRQKIAKAALLMYQCQDETGDMPNYGSNDGALIFPVTSCGYRRFDPVINTAHALSAGTQICGEGKHCEELIWFSGGRRLCDFPVQPVTRRSSDFPGAGLFTLRNSASWAMVVLNDFRSRPAQMDQLHFDLWADGVNVLCDSGTYSYAVLPGSAYMTNLGHNTAVADRALQMSLHGPFMIYNWTKSKTEGFDGRSFEGTVISKNGYTHRRRIVCDDRVYRISDLMSAKGRIIFHTPCDVSVSGGEAVLSLGGRRICTLSFEGEILVEKSKRSLFYLQETETNSLIFGCEENKAIEITITISEGEAKQ